jgi:hypothetical protein
VQTSAGFGVAIPATWVDGPHATGLNAPFDVLSLHDPATGARLTVLAQDVGGTPVKVEADLVAANLERTGTVVPEVPDDSAGVPGYHMTWEFQGENDAYIVKGSDNRRYDFFFTDVPGDVRSAVLGSFVSFALPSVTTIPLTEAGADGFTVDLPSSWGEQGPKPIDSKTAYVLLRTGVEGTVIVTRITNSDISIDDEAEKAKQALDLKAVNGSVQVTHTTFGGRAAIRVDGITRQRSPNDITAPGIRTLYIVQQGADTLLITLEGSDSSRTHQLLDQIGGSFRLTR